MRWETTLTAFGKVGGSDQVHDQGDVHEEGNYRGTHGHPKGLAVRKAFMMHNAECRHCNDIDDV
jgi:hypothetical protein